MDKESRNPEPRTQNLLLESLAWLDFCLGETQAALAAVKEAALDGLRTAGGDARPTGGEAVSPEQFAAMCEAGAEVINLRARASRRFRASCPISQETRGADET